MIAQARTIVTANWLTQKPLPKAGGLTIWMTLILLGSCFAFFNDLLAAHSWMPATAELVFQKHQYWRLWTTLFAHADNGHLFSNAFLFIPLAYLLAAHFGALFFPLAGIALGGVTNFLVLQALPEDVFLIGISGVVYWMGAAWLMLFVLIDLRKSLRRRIAIALFLTMMLFVPETYKQEVSYLSHAVGFFLGVLSAIIYYVFHRRKILAAIEVQEILEEDEENLEPTGTFIDAPINSSDELNAGSEVELLKGSVENKS